MAKESFETTHWSLVEAAADSSSVRHRQALQQICSKYWYPVYLFFRRQFDCSQRPEDLTQAYFVALLEKNFLSQADATRGRFRYFLLASARNFLSHQRDHERAQKRGGARRHFSIDSAAAEERYRLEPSNELTAEQLFERRWAMMLLDAALKKLRRRYERQGKANRFDALSRYLQGSGRKSYAVTADELGVSVDVVKQEVRRLRRRFGETLRKEIEQTLEFPSDEKVEDEIRYLFSTIAP